MIEAFLDQQFALQARHFRTNHPNADFLIITRQDSISTSDIGRLYLDRSDDNWRLMELSLFSGWRAKGFGGMLLSWISTAAADASASVIDLQVARDNPRAKALYARHGYRIQGPVTATHRAMRLQIS